MRRSERTRGRRGGFSIVETFVSVAVLLLLTSAVTFNLAAAAESKRRDKDIKLLNSAANAISWYVASERGGNYGSVFKAGINPFHEALVDDDDFGTLAVRIRGDTRALRIYNVGGVFALTLSEDGDALVSQAAYVEKTERKRYEPDKVVLIRNTSLHW